VVLWQNKNVVSLSRNITSTFSSQQKQEEHYRQGLEEKQYTAKASGSGEMTNDEVSLRSTRQQKSAANDK